MPSSGLNAGDPESCKVMNDRVPAFTELTVE